jgi:hypothetical protein
MFNREVSEACRTYEKVRKSQKDVNKRFYKRVHLGTTGVDGRIRVRYLR